MYRSVPQIRPPFCNLSLGTKRRDTRDAPISLVVTPSLPAKHVGVGAKRRAQGEEMLPTLEVH